MSLERLPTFLYSKPLNYLEGIENNVMSIY